MQPNSNPNNQPNPEQPVAPESQPAPAAPEVAPAAPQGTTQPAQLPQIPTAAPVIDPSTIAGDQAAPSAPAATPATPTPPVAGDVDVIEKEWVDQADKIVEQTKDDPYVEEEAVEALQQDYLKKRYNHDVKKPGQ